MAPTKPEVDPHDGPAPADLLIEDITVGDGAEATAGQFVSVHYVGVSHSTGEQFDASWDAARRSSSRSAAAASSRAGTRASRA